MTEQYQPPSGEPPTKKPSLWQRFKRWPLIARIGTIGCGGLILLFFGLIVLGGIITIINPDLAEEAADQQEDTAEVASTEEDEAQDEEEDEPEPEPDMVAVPDVSGQPGNEARDALEDEGFDVNLVSDDGEVVNAANWEVESTSPSAGDEAEDGSEVTVSVVRPEEPGVEVPDVVGMPGDEAQGELEDAGFDVELVAEDSSVWSPGNWEVESTDPEAGSEVEEGAEVTVNVVRPDSDDDEDEEEDEPEEIPEGIDAQVEAITDLHDFSDSEAYYSEGDETYPRTSVHVDTIAGVGWSESTMCQSARSATIKGLQFLRDSVTEEYDEAVFSFSAESEPDATGDSSLLGMATVYYDYETVQSIDDSSVNVGNVWEAADNGGLGVVCQRAEG